jgi:hypothetical protein
MATATCSRLPAIAQWRTEQLLFRDAASAVLLFSTYLLYSGQLWQQLCNISEDGVAVPLQESGTIHPASMHIWQVMCWAGTQATGIPSIAPGTLTWAWTFVNRVRRPAMHAL